MLLKYKLWSPLYTWLRFRYITESFLSLLITSFKSASPPILFFISLPCFAFPRRTTGVELKTSSFACCPTPYINCNGSFLHGFVMMAANNSQWDRNILRARQTLLQR